jgi:hypothetical protein
MTVKIEERHYISSHTDAYGRTVPGYTESFVHEYRPPANLSPESWETLRNGSEVCFRATCGCFDSRPACCPKKYITISTMTAGFLCSAVGGITNNDSAGVAGIYLLGISVLMMGFNAFSYCCCRQEEGTRTERQPLLARRVTSV